MILGQAALAAANGATWLCIGTELDQIAGPAYKAYWDNIIAAIRAAYPSLKLTYAADWDTDLRLGRRERSRRRHRQSGDADQFRWRARRFRDRRIRADLERRRSYARRSHRGLDGNARRHRRDRDTYAVTGGQSLIAYYESVAAEVGKPLLFTEMGYANSSDGGERPGALQRRAAQKTTRFRRSFTRRSSRPGDSRATTRCKASISGTGIRTPPRWATARSTSARKVCRRNPSSSASSRRGAPLDFTGDGRSDILFQNASGALWTWHSTTRRSPAAGKSGRRARVDLRTSADFAGDGRCDPLWLSASGSLWYWDIEGTSIVGGGYLGVPAGLGRLWGPAISTATVSATSCFRTRAALSRSGS